MDVLRVQGVHPRVDGEYECDIAGLIDVSSDEALTVREAQFVRDFSGARGGEIVEAFLAGDMSVRSALAMVILRRKQVPLRDDTVMDLRSGWARFELVAVDEEEEEDEAGDPPTEEDEPETPQESSGTGSVTSSENQEDVPSRIGVPA